MRLWRYLAVACVAVATSGCKLPHKSSQATPDASPRSTEDVLAATLPGVVLLVSRHADGAIGFGAGIVIDDEGGVLTNLHVVADGTLGALLYDPKRVSYIPQDGGLSRYLFENDSSISDARLERADPVLDLAFVKIKAPTKGLKLAFRTEPIKQGDRVMAVGHPGETVWSFTSGVVSSLHQDMLQTDAAINRGNSGGPLIDTNGLVVGVNTSKLVGDMHGIGFARPIALAKPLIEGHSSVVQVDRSSPESTMKTCWRAIEVGADAYIDCIDWENMYDVIQDSFARRLKILRLKGAAKEDYERRANVYSKDELIAIMKRQMMASLRGEDIMTIARETMAKSKSVPLTDAAAADYKRAFPKMKTDAKLRQEMMGPDGGVSQFTRQIDDAIFARTGMKIDHNNQHAMTDIVKMGIRFEQARVVDDTHAFVAARGRNTDGTEYRAAHLLRKHPDGWVIVTVPMPKEEALRPADFPNLASSYEEDMNRRAELEAKMMQPTKPEKKAEPRKRER